MKEVQFCSIEKLRPFPRNDNEEHANYINEILDSSPFPVGHFHHNWDKAFLKWTQFFFRNKVHSIL